MKEPRWCNRLVVLVLDKDADSSENRYEHAMKDVPPELVNSRVFVIGALTEPEKLFRESGKSRRTFPGRSLTEVGGDLAYQCTHDATGDYDPQPGDAVDNRITWNQENLRHNLTVVKGLRAKIREMGDFLFE